MADGECFHNNVNVEEESTLLQWHCKDIKKELNEDENCNILPAPPLDIVCKSEIDIEPTEIQPPDVYYMLHPVKQEHSDFEPPRKALVSRNDKRSSRSVLQSLENSLSIVNTHCTNKESENTSSTITDNGSYTCSACEITFLTQSNMSRHCRQFHNNGNFDEYVCDICGSTFKQRRYVQEHMMIVHNSGKLTCKHCNRVFKNSKYLNRHVAVVHLQKAYRKCEYCHKRFITVHKLNGHMQYCNGREVKNLTKLTLTCTVCKIVFTDHSSLLDHKKIHQYECNICQSTYFSVSGLRRHLKKKHAVRMNSNSEQTCFTCFKVFSSSYKLKMHSKKPCRFACGAGHCKKTYTSASSLKRHMNSQHDKSYLIRPPSEYICNICSRIFVNKGHLASHMRKCSSASESQLKS